VWWWCYKKKKVFHILFFGMEELICWPDAFVCIPELRIGSSQQPPWMQQQLSASLFEVFEINLFRKTFTSSRWLLAAAGRTFLSLFSSKTYNTPPTTTAAQLYILQPYR
jgi:hypothetical protein